MGKQEIITEQSGLLVGNRKDCGHMCKGEAPLGICSMYLTVCKGKAEGRLLLQAEMSGMHLLSQTNDEGGGGGRCNAQRIIYAKAGG